MKSLLSLLVIVLLSASIYACGGTSKATSTSSTSSKALASDTTSTPNSASIAPAPVDSKPDSDKDNDSDALEDDKNNDSTLNYGHEANASDTRAITSIVNQYYAAALAENGAKACPLIYSTIAELAPETFGQSPPGPPYAHGTTCPEVMVSLFKHFHNQLVAEVPKLRISRVRLHERHGLVVLTFGTMPERQFSVEREGHVWKLEALMDSELP